MNARGKYSKAGRAKCDALKATMDIVQVVGSVVALEHNGLTYRGLCPFHSEQTPSFHVNPVKGFYHCFGCGAGGTVVKFIERYAELLSTWPADTDYDD